MSAPVRSVAICGSGLALWMSAAALATGLPDGVTVKAVESAPDAPMDALYGGVLPPEFYGFHSEIGLSEPELLQNTRTGFCWGTRVSNWTTEKRNWVQPFHLPLLVWEGVALDKVVGSVPGASLQDVLISAVAARAGVFAHPPEDASHPLSRAEYGYTVDPAELAKVYRGIASRAGVTIASGALSRQDRDGETLPAITLVSGERVEADLFIDASGPGAGLLGASRETDGARTVHFTVSIGDGRAAVRSVTAEPDGYTVSVPLTGEAQTLTLSDGPSPDSTAVTIDGPDATPAWTGNVVAIGSAAAVLDPVSVAPMRMLLRDVRRVLSLFPVATDMAVEARLYNQARGDDHRHAAIFNQAHYAGFDFPDTSFWRDAQTERHPALARKLALYSARGYLVAYDHEPFESLDWAVLHDGIGRTVKRADRLASAIAPERAAAHVSARQRTIAALVSRMPLHDAYRGKLLDYLARKHAAHA